MNNSPISVLAGLLDFSLNSLACLAPRTGIYKSSVHQIGSQAKTATSPRIPSGGHYSKLFIQAQTLSGMGKWFQHCWEGTAAAFCCWRMTDFLFPSSPLSIPLTYSLFLSLSLLLLLFLNLIGLISSPALSNSLFNSCLFLSHMRTHTHRRIHRITHKGIKLWKYISRNISPRYFNGALSHFSFVEKKRNTNMLCAHRVEQSVCVFLQYELAVSTCHHKCGYPEVRL